MLFADCDKCDFIYVTLLFRSSLNLIKFLNIYRILNTKDNTFDYREAAVRFEQRNRGWIKRYLFELR